MQTKQIAKKNSLINKLEITKDRALAMFIFTFISFFTTVVAKFKIICYKKVFIYRKEKECVYAT